MFEYLMPKLFVESYPSTLMDQSCRAAIEQHIKYGNEHNIPWGTSESSYYNLDAAQVYQYQAFGVPSLGYKRGLSDDLVVAPYASILALPFIGQNVLDVARGVGVRRFLLVHRDGGEPAPPFADLPFLAGSIGLRIASVLPKLSLPPWLVAAGVAGATAIASGVCPPPDWGGSYYVKPFS